MGQELGLHFANIRAEYGRHNPILQMLPLPLADIDLVMRIQLVRQHALGLHRCHGIHLRRP